MKSLVIDTETGGLVPGINPLLSVGLVVVDQLGIQDMTQIDLQSHAFLIDPESMKVNEIDLVEWNSLALPAGQLGQEMEKFLSPHGDEFIPVGWNIGFDLAFINRYTSRLVSSYHKIDLSDVCLLLNMAHVLPRLLSLDSALKHFGIKFQGQRHSASADALATARLYQKLKHHVEWNWSK